MTRQAFSRRFARLLGGVDLVTFDIFDTAVLRGLARPVDLFRQLAMEGEARGLLPVAVTDHESFARAREAAEQGARGAAWETEGRTEIRLAEIYARLAEDLGLEPDAASALMEAERRIELAHGMRNAYIGGLYDMARRAGKRVGFLSDMYLDEELVRALLDKAGYAGHEFLLLSSSTMATKATGALYRFVLDRQAIEPGRWLHVGDNLDSDVRRAREQGIHALHYEKCEHRLAAHPVMGPRAAFDPAPDASAEARLFRSISRGLTAGTCLADPDAAGGDFWKDWGYRHAGPLLAGFGTWLMQALRAGGYRDVYFLARDGYLIKEVVERMLRADGAPAGGTPGTHYLYASRRAFNLAAITALDEESQDFLVSGTSRMAPRQFLARVDIDVDDHLDKVNAAGFASPDEIVDGGPGYGRLRALFRSLEAEVLARAAAELETLTRYFREQGLLDGGRVAIVDLGWHGSLQNALAGLLGRMRATTRLAGYYMGTFAAARRYLDRGHELHGYLCEEGRPGFLHDAIKTAVEVFEWIFSAPHGSVCYLRAEGEEIRPVFADFDFESERWTAAEEMQAGALRFVDDYLAVWRGQVMPPVPPGEAVRALHAALLRPTREEARRLGDLRHAEGFGQVAVARYIARPPGSFWNPLSYPELVRGYRRAFWKAAYKRRLFGLRR